MKGTFFLSQSSRVSSPLLIESQCSVGMFLAMAVQVRIRNRVVRVCGWLRIRARDGPSCSSSATHRSGSLSAWESSSRTSSTRLVCLRLFGSRESEGKWFGFSLLLWTVIELSLCEMVAEIYGVGVFASGFGLSCSFFLDTNAIRWKGKVFNL